MEPSLSKGRDIAIMKSTGYLSRGLSKRRTQDALGLPEPGVWADLPP